MNKKIEKYFETAVILAGGKSSRMGFDKQLLEYHNKKLITILIENLKEVFKEIIVVTKTPELYINDKIKTCSDIIPGKGPLSGIHSAFNNCNSDYIFLMACDMTAFSKEYALIEAERMEDENTIACITKNGKRLEPFHAFYSRKILPDVTKSLLSEHHSIMKLFEDKKITQINIENIRCNNIDRLFLNLNTPEDYKKFLTAKKDN